MLKIRPDILPQLKCAFCDGYLNITPVMINSDKRQLCGRCFEILPTDEKNNCYRQAGYEALAQMLLFPCRYHSHGCQSEFPLNEADNHEVECPLRFDSLGCISQPRSEYENSLLGKRISNENVSSETEKGTSFVVMDATESMVVTSSYTVKVNKLTQVPTILKYDINIQGDDKKGIYLNVECSEGVFHNNPRKKNVFLTIEGALFLSRSSNVFCKVTMNPCNEPIYQTISENHQNYDKCKNCLENPIRSTPELYCRNFFKGCLVYLNPSERYLHERDCKFGEWTCPFSQEGCLKKLATLDALKAHLKDRHLASIILSNLVVRESVKNQDEFWIMYAFDALFKCKRFSYVDQMEFLVEYVGPRREAEKFKFELHLKSDDNKLARGANCVGWDASALDKTLKITKEELKASKHNFTYTLILIKM